MGLRSFSSHPKCLLAFIISCHDSYTHVVPIKLETNYFLTTQLKSTTYNN